MLSDLQHKQTPLQLTNLQKKHSKTIVTTFSKININIRIHNIKTNKDNKQICKSKRKQNKIKNITMLRCIIPFFIHSYIQYENNQTNT